LRAEPGGWRRVVRSLMPKERGSALKYFYDQVRTHMSFSILNPKYIQCKLEDKKGRPEAGRPFHWRKKLFVAISKN
ncbi:hypothetical protein KJ039_02680, partial [bacterium]|nr:hypothetical protein [bacterium]